MTACSVCQSIACTAGPNAHPGEEVKVGYRTTGGRLSIAYIVKTRGSRDAAGTDKYTGETVTVRWDGLDWRETAGRDDR